MERSEGKVGRTYNIVNQIRLDKKARLPSSTGNIKFGAVGVEQKRAIITKACRINDRLVLVVAMQGFEPRTLRI